MEDKDFLSGPSSINIEDVMSEIRARLANTEIQLKEPVTSAFEDFGRTAPTGHVLPDNNEIVQQNNLNWDIDLEWDLTSHRKFIGPVIAFGKRIVRKLLRWYILRPWQQQIEFNASVARSISEQAKLAHENTKTLDEMKRYLDEMKRYVDQTATGISDEQLFISERIRRLEQPLKDQVIRITEQDCTVPSAQNVIEFDYFMFEQRFRGSRQEIKERQRVYVDFFKDKHEVLDLGCGRGEFLELMRDSGISATGVDSNPDMVSFVRDLGLNIEDAEVRSYLKDMTRKIDGIFSAQLIEHLNPADMLDLIRICYDKLDQGGVLALETVNPTCLSVFAESFYMDLSHIRPVHPLTLAFVLKQEGFVNVQTLYLSPFSDTEKMPKLSIEGAEEFNAGIERLNSRLFSYRDFAVIGEKR